MIPWPDVPLKPLPSRIILHWTGGTYRANAVERGAYHYLVEGDGRIVAGVPVAWNMRHIPSGTDMTEYAAHCRGLNSWSVGVAFCGMLDAVPGGPYGIYPLTEIQVVEGCKFLAYLCDVWHMPPSVQQVFTHAEADRIHGVRQPHKWDIDVLPWLDLAPADTGKWIRDRIRKHTPRRDADD